jgi:hypothetical protein
MKKHKPWFNEGCSKLLDKRKQAKLLCLHNPREINGDNLKDKINELATNSKNKNIRDLYRGINEFKSGYQPRNNFMKDENGDLFADSYNILNRWKNYLSQLLNVHNVRDVRHIKKHTTGPLVSGPSCLDVEIATAKLKTYKSPGSNQTPAELIPAGGDPQTH